MAESRLMSAEDMEQLRAELHRLETEERAKVVEQIKTAREWGDLKENAEYHAAKEAQSHLETRIRRLRERWRNAVVVHVTDSPAATFSFGRSAKVRDEETGEVHTWTIVGAAEADIAQRKLSAESPVAKALLDRASGDTVEVPTPRGTRRLTIERIF